MNCVFCGETMDTMKVGFKACCSSCGHYLHSCVQCNLFERSSGRCRSHTTESVRDLEGLNYCEEYVPRSEDRSGNSSSGSSTSDAAERFNSLFSKQDSED